MTAFLLVQCCGIVGFFLGCLLGVIARRRRAVVHGGALAVLVMLVFKTLLTWQPVWEATLFPFTWYVYLQDYWIAAIGLLFFGFVTPQMPVVWNRWVLAGIALLVFARGVDHTWWILKPEKHGEMMSADVAHQRTQTTGYTCAPCACVSALSYVGITTTEREMAERCLTREDGTTIFNTYRGLMLSLEGTPWRVRMAKIPAEMLVSKSTIAVIDWPQIRHAIAVIGTGTAVTVHDPLRDEPFIQDVDTLRAKYGGIAMLIEPR